VALSVDSAEGEFPDARGKFKAVGRCDLLRAMHTS